MLRPLFVKIKKCVQLAPFFSHAAGSVEMCITGTILTQKNTLNIFLPAASSVKMCITYIFWPPPHGPHHFFSPAAGSVKMCTTDTLSLKKRP